MNEHPIRNFVCGGLLAVVSSLSSGDALSYPSPDNRNPLTYQQFKIGEFEEGYFSGVGRLEEITKEHGMDVTSNREREFGTKCPHQLHKEEFQVDYIK